tara:strand:- start:11741 stop:13213 length:1473 start_codon:yes stop_codon:yes gene_type:complete
MSQPPNTVTHPLSFLDQQPHIRNYGRHLTIFPFPAFSPSHADAAVHALRTGLAVTLQRFPQLAGSLSIPDRTTGKLRLVHPQNINAATDINRIFSPSFAVVDDPKFSFDTLAARHFDPNDFPADIFCPALLKNHPGLDDGDAYATGPTTLAKDIDVPVMAAQATFVHGGLVLSVWCHHCVADGTGMRRVYSTWSRGVRNGVEITADADEGEGQGDGDGDGGSVEEMLDTLARSSAPEQTLPHPPTAAVKPGLRTGSYQVSTKLLRFSQDKIVALAHTLSTLTRTRISPFIALAALTWSHIHLARSALLSPFSTQSSSLAVVVDLRGRLGGTFERAATYIGNCVLSAKPHIESLPAMVGSISPEAMAPFALRIADALGTFDRGAITARLATLVASNAATPAIDCQDLRFANGPDVYITDWRGMGMDNEWGVPGTSSATPVAMRRACWSGEGGIVVLPRGRGGEGAWEVLVSLAEEDEMELEAGLGGVGGWK